MDSRITPLLVGEMLDRLTGDMSAASVVSAALSVLMDADIQCKLHGDCKKCCELIVPSEIRDSINDIVEFVLGIPTVGDHYNYEYGQKAFDTCIVNVQFYFVRQPEKDEN